MERSAVNYRNTKLLQAARNVPYCMGCGKVTDGTIVAAHSDQIRDDKGTGIKAHDYRIAYLCYTCHENVGAGQLSREEKREIWERAHRASIGWMFETGVVK